MPSASLKLLQSALQQEAQLASEFLAILADEEQALSLHRPADALNTIISRKNSLANKLTTAGQQREQLQQVICPSLPVTDLSQLAQLYPSLEPSISRLLMLGRQASELNQHIGRLIQEQLRQNQDALDFLASLTASPRLYDTHGRSQRSATTPTTTIKAG